METSSKRGKIIILDTSAFLAGFDPFLAEGTLCTVPLVKEEITGRSMTTVRFETAVQSGKIRVKSPSVAFLDKVKMYADQVGDTLFLSDTDYQILALALELRADGHEPFILTDDYSIQNVANQMKIGFMPLTTLGIRRRWQWLRYCPACHKKFTSRYKAKKCDVCGTELKRKPYKKDRLKYPNQVG